MMLRYTWYVGFCTVLLVVMLSWSGIARSWLPTFWPVTKVKVVGKIEHISPETMKKVTAKYLNTGFFGFDVESLKRDVQNLSWVKEVSVRRGWPDSVSIMVHEHKAVASWNDRYLINTQGELFESDDLLPGKVVDIRGPEGMHRSLLEQCQELQAQFGIHGLRLAKLSLNKRRALEMRLGNGVNFVFGRVHGVNESGSAISKFLLAYDHGLNAKMNQVKTVDMRYTNGFSVRWRLGRKKYKQNHRSG